MWKCKPCKVEFPLTDKGMERARQHLRTKKHDRLKSACPRCSSRRMKRLDGETWDRDGIRDARKCGRCLTEYKSYASGIVEKDVSEYTGEWPEHIKRQEAEAFDRAARARGYSKVPQSEG